MVDPPPYSCQEGEKAAGILKRETIGIKLLFALLEVLDLIGNREGGFHLSAVGTEVLAFSFFPS